MVTLVVLRKRFLLWVCSTVCLLLQSLENEKVERFHSCLCCCRNSGWWGLVWPTCDESRFKKTCKEYHNFKNFYSIVMMAIVNAHDCFIWVSVGFPGNLHDLVILQSTELWQDVTENNIIPSIAKTIEGIEGYPMIWGILPSHSESR